MYLNATLSASPFDENYGMALVYCFDKGKNYCFSLSRFPEEDEIEIIISDQINHKVHDLSVQLEKKTLTINLDRGIAAKLDGHTTYTIALLDVDEIRLLSLRDALRKIFEGKKWASNYNYGSSTPPSEQRAGCTG